MKKCSRCKSEKPTSEFYKHRSRKDGLMDHCRPCERTRFKAIYDSSPSLRLSAKERAIKWASDNKEARRKIDDRRNEKTRLQFPEKLKARKRVHYLVYSGQMPPPSSLNCVECGSQAKHYHHHKGYSPEYAIDVVPVCPACHYVIDRLYSKPNPSPNL